MYIGRFAPSPTGELHFGSLLAALASYLDAKSNNGLWLLRIDDLDPPRETIGASQKILESLNNYGLNWDREVIYQSQRYTLYQQALEKLLSTQLTYACNCSRKSILERSGKPSYDSYCLSNPPSNTDISHPICWRFNTGQETVQWLDGIQGPQIYKESQLSDFIIKRSNNLWAYQLAVSVDDQQMGVTHIVRGQDLLRESANQLLLIKSLKLNSIQFSHIPTLTNLKGQKLSKQNLAPPLSANNISRDLFKALILLGQNPQKSLLNASKADILHSAIINWNINAIPLDYSSIQTGV